MRQFYVKGLNTPQFISNQHLITSIRLVEGPGHDTVTVWNRGGCSGSLTVNLGDGMTIVDCLLPENIRVEEER
jgi:hypothetical protein